MAQAKIKYYNVRWVDIRLGFKMNCLKSKSQSIVLSHQKSLSHQVSLSQWMSFFTQNSNCVKINDKKSFQGLSYKVIISLLISPVQSKSIFLKICNWDWNVQPIFLCHWYLLCFLFFLKATDNFARNKINIFKFHIDEEFSLIFVFCICLFYSSISIIYTLKETLLES